MLKKEKENILLKMSEVTEIKDLKEFVNDDKLEDSFIDESELADNTEEEDHVTEYGEAKY